MEYTEQQHRAKVADAIQYIESLPSLADSISKDIYFKNAKDFAEGRKDFDTAYDGDGLGYGWSPYSSDMVCRVLLNKPDLAMSVAKTYWGK